MSVSAYLDVVLACNEKPDWVVSIFRSLTEFGWRYRCDEKVVYLPIGDGDAFNWCSADLKESELLECIRRKSEIHEIVGVAMTYEETGVGGEFLFLPDGVLSFSISTNRLRSSGVMDVTWYMSKIVPPIKESKWVIVSLKYEEF